MRCLGNPLGRRGFLTRYLDLAMAAYVLGLVCIFLIADRIPARRNIQERTTMNWISIKDKLPKKHEFVLFCCYIEDEEGFGDVDLGWYEGQKTRGDAIVMETRSGDHTWWMPCTHWMPLPETPKAP